jgi:hypothetical protein
MTNNIFATAADSVSNTQEEDTMCKNLLFSVICVAPGLDELDPILESGGICSFEGMYVNGMYCYSAYCQENEIHQESECFFGKCMLDFPCAEDYFAQEAEYRAQVNLNHLLHEADDYWIDLCY